jgi:hypothetical protein
MLVNRIVDPQRRDLSGIAAGDGRAALQRRNLSDLAGLLVGASGRTRILRARRKWPKHRRRRRAHSTEPLDEVAALQDRPLKAPRQESPRNRRRKIGVTKALEEGRKKAAIC